MFELTVLPEKKVIRVNSGDNLRQVLLDNGHEINSPCGGYASCARCIVIAKGNNEGCLSEVSFEEQQLLGNVYHLTNERLSCQVKILGDMSVDISSHLSNVKKNSSVVRRTKSEADAIIEKRKEIAKERPQKQGGLKRPKIFKEKKEVE